MSKETPCGKCDAKCCRYFALEIDKPTTRRDFEHVRWYLCHEGTRVFVEKGKWHLEVRNACRHLDERSRCRIYPDRPIICREHSPEECEHADSAFDHDHEFHSDEDLERYVQKRFARKGKKRRPSGAREH